MSIGTTRWSTTLPSKVNLHYAIQFRALYGPNVVTYHPQNQPQRNPRSPPSGERRGHVVHHLPRKSSGRLPVAKRCLSPYSRCTKGVWARFQSKHRSVWGAYSRFWRRFQGARASQRKLLHPRILLVMCNHLCSDVRCQILKETYIFPD